MKGDFEFIKNPYKLCIEEVSPEGWDKSLSFDCESKYIWRLIPEVVVVKSLMRLANIAFAKHCDLVISPNTGANVSVGCQLAKHVGKSYVNPTLAQSCQWSLHSFFISFSIIYDKCKLSKNGGKGWSYSKEYFLNEL